MMVIDLIIGWEMLIMGLLVGLAVGWLGGYVQRGRMINKFRQEADEWAARRMKWEKERERRELELNIIIDQLQRKVLENNQALEAEREQRVFYQMKAAHLDECVEKLEKLQNLYDELKLSTDAAHARIRKINGGDK